MTKFPGWRTMTGVQRRNAKMDAMFERARAQGHTTFRATPEVTRPELSYDGKGINGPDLYRERVATFRNDACAAQYGPLFATSPDLLAACQAAAEVLKEMLRTVTDDNAAADAIDSALQLTSAAIARATKPGVSDD